MQANKKVCNENERNKQENMMPITLQADSCHNLDPVSDLHKLSDTQSILMYHSVVKV